MRRENSWETEFIPRPDHSPEQGYWLGNEAGREVGSVEAVEIPRNFR